MTYEEKSYVLQNYGQYRIWDDDSGYWHGFLASHDGTEVIAEAGHNLDQDAALDELIVNALSFYAHKAWMLEDAA